MNVGLLWGIWRHIMNLKPKQTKRGYSFLPSSLQAMSVVFSNLCKYNLYYDRLSIYPTVYLLVLPWCSIIQLVGHILTRQETQ